MGIRRWPPRAPHGSFFSVVGVRALLRGGGTFMRAMIHQPEVGILGFVVSRHGDEPCWLVQAKTEPGNVGGTQLAPTVQATVSNYMRVHGGAKTPYLEYFLDSAGESCRCVADVLGSEQGSRFFGKYNRNMTVVCDHEMPTVVGHGWHWLSAHALRETLVLDFCLNTDARSAVWSSDWALLADNGRPFSRWDGRGGYEESLLESYRADEIQSLNTDRHIVERLSTAATERVFMGAETMPLESLHEWVIDAERIYSPRHAEFEIRPYAVRVSDREVETWCQPLVRSTDLARVVLLCQRHNGVLHFLLRINDEPGLTDHPQFGPTYQSDGFVPVKTTAAAQVEEWAVSSGLTSWHVQFRQSDEGGRFMGAIVEFGVAEVPESEAVIQDPDYCWATLRQLSMLARANGMLTNEARSVLSALLHYL